MEHRRFKPSAKREDLIRCYNNSFADVIRVMSMQEGNELEYKFRGVLDFEEFLNAVTYVMLLDVRRFGQCSAAARCGYCVYTHGMKDKVKRSLDRWLGGDLSGNT